MSGLGLDSFVILDSDNKTDKMVIKNLKEIKILEEILKMIFNYIDRQNHKKWT